MANRFWVGGNGTWDASDTTHWSATTGGAGGASVPGSSDRVVVDANSGNGLITRAASAGTIDKFYMSGNSTIELSGDMLCLTYLDVENGTFTANNHNVTAGYFYIQASSGSVPTINMGSGIWEATADDWQLFEYDGESVVLNISTSTIKLSGTTSDIVFWGGNKTYYDVWIAHGTSAYDVYLRDSNSFRHFKDDGTVAHKIYRSSGSTNTFQTFTVRGGSGQLITIDNEVERLHTDATYGDALDNLYSGAKTMSGQSFNGIGGKLVQLETAITKFGSPTGSAYMEIYAHTGTFGSGGTATGSALATSDAFDVSTLSASIGYKTFAFSGANQIQLDSGTDYVAVIRYDGGDSSNYVKTYGTTTDTLPGNAMSFTSPTWTAVTKDMGFKLWAVSDTQHIFSKPYGVVNCDYLNISNSNATGGAKWVAGSHSTDTLNNDGWIFADAPSNSGFLSIM